MELHAWDQYEHLAYWLIDLGSLFEISGTKFEKSYLELVKYSFSYVSEELERSEDLKKGYSWKAHSIWKSNFESLTPLNKKLIRVNVDPESFSDFNTIDKIIMINGMKHY